MKKLITLRGNSGSGKTTIARALQEKFGKNTMLLSQDVIRRDILKTNDGAAPAQTTCSLCCLSTATRTTSSSFWKAF